MCSCAVLKTLSSPAQEGGIGQPCFGIMTRFGNRAAVHHSGEDPHSYLWERGIHDFDSIIHLFDSKPKKVWADSFNPPWSPYKGGGGGGWGGKGRRRRGGGEEEHGEVQRGGTWSTITLTPILSASATIWAASFSVLQKGFSTCPAPKPPVLSKRPARPHNSAIQTRFTVGNADGA